MQPFSFRPYFCSSVTASKTHVKKIDKLVLGSFLGPFVLTYAVVNFVLLMVKMIQYFDDLIGKDLGWDVLGTFIWYLTILLTPGAMPLAVLLASLIAFGNLGEHFELTAVKSLGVSLLRTLRPIFVFVLFLTGVAFIVNNFLVPKAALETYSLLFDIKQKKPALDLREGTFFNGIPEISIKVDKKFPDGITLKKISQAQELMKTARSIALQAGSMGSIQNLGKGKREISGLVTQARFIRVENRRAYFEVVIEPWLTLATCTNDYKIYQHKNVVAIIKEVLADYNYPCIVNTIESYPERVFQAQ